MAPNNGDQLPHRATELSLIPGHFSRDEEAIEGNAADNQPAAPAGSDHRGQLLYECASKGTRPAAGRGQKLQCVE